MLELRVSAHEHSGVLAVGYGERGAPLPTAVRVLEFEVGELVAQGVAERLASGPACGGHPVLVDLDALVEHAERVVAVSATRRRRSWAGDQQEPG